MRDAVSNTTYMCYTRVQTNTPGTLNIKSHPPPTYDWWLSHSPLSIEAPASRRKMRVLREAVLARYDWPLFYDKLAMSNIYWHAKNRNDPSPITLSKVAFLESGFSAVAILGGGWLQSPASDGPPCNIYPVWFENMFCAVPDGKQKPMCGLYPLSHW